MLQFKRCYPRDVHCLRKGVQRGEVTIGKMFVVDTGQLDGPEHIINFPPRNTGVHRRSWPISTPASLISSAWIRELNIASVAVSASGQRRSGLGDVEQRLVSAFQQLPGRRRRDLPPSGGSRAIEALEGPDDLGARRHTRGDAAISPAAPRDGAGKTCRISHLRFRSLA